MRFNDAYFKDIKKNLVKRVKERQKVERMRHPDRPKKNVVSPSFSNRTFLVNWMQYRMGGTGNLRHLYYRLPNGTEIKHTVRLTLREAHRIALMLSRELRNSPNLMAELSTPTIGDTPDGS